MTTLIDRARAYVAAMPPGISGENGHSKTFNVAVVLRHGFNLSQEDSWPILVEYNNRCSPPWNFQELRHKLASVDGQRHPKTAGHLAEGEALKSMGRVRTRRTHFPALFKLPKVEQEVPQKVLGVVSIPDRYLAPLPAEVREEVTMEEKVKRAVVRPAPPEAPVGWCGVCWDRWGRALRTGCCICSGHVQLSSRF